MDFSERRRFHLNRPTQNILLLPPAVCSCRLPSAFWKPPPIRRLFVASGKRGEAMTLALTLLFAFNLYARVGRSV